MVLFLSFERISHSAAEALDQAEPFADAILVATPPLFLLHRNTTLI
jgi:hypothetical protein